MPSSTYKGYELQTTGSNVGTWGTELNNKALSYIDQNVGGITSTILSASNIALSESESRSAILRLTGTLLANVTVTTYAQGFFFVENLTSGNFTVSVRNTSVATAATVPQGTRATLISDSTNGVRIASEYNPFAAGTTLTFIQASAPSGWTKSTSHDNKALRVVSSSGGGSGGSTAFTSVFAARTITASNLPDHNITVTDPGHFHGISMQLCNGGFGLQGSGGGAQYLGQVYVSGGTTNTVSKTTGITSAFGTTARGGAQTTMDFAVAYVDAIICVKD